MSKVTLGLYRSTYIPCSRDPERDLRCASYALGTQGTGKSTLLANLAEQFAAAGEGVLIVDTKGELAEDIASRTAHTDKLIYVAPGETAFPTGSRYWALNPFEFDRSQPHLESVAVGNLLSLFERMGLARLDTMVQVRQLLQMSARLALALPQPTLPDLMAILHQPSLRARLLDDRRVQPAVRQFWTSFGAMTANQQREKANSTLPRLNEFLSDPVVSHLVTPPRSTVRLTEWLDQGKLVVCNLGSKLSLDVSRLLGNFVVASLVNAAYARPTVNEARVRTWRVFVDEFQELAGPQFAELITQARKYSVFPVIAHQNLSQIGDELTNAVLSCPLRFFLATSAEDRGMIRRLFGDETARGLSELPRFTARVQMREGVEGRFRQETLRLKGWWAERDPEQLRTAQLAAGNDRYTLVEDAEPHDPMHETVCETPRNGMHGISEPSADQRVAGEGDDSDGPNLRRQNGRAIDELGTSREEAPTGTDQPQSSVGSTLSPQTHRPGRGDAARPRPPRAVDELAGR